MAAWRATQPILPSPRGTWIIRGAPPTAWEGVYPPERAWHWSYVPTPHAMWSYAVLTTGGWRWQDVGLHPTLVPVAMAVSGANSQLPWNVRI